MFGSSTPDCAWAPLLVALLASACGDEPAPRSAYAGAPLSILSPACDPQTLRDGDDRPCVFIERFAVGAGPSVGDGDWVRVHYIAELADGSTLDSSHDGKPLAIKLGESHDVIEGMHLGIHGMQLGERRRLRVPPQLGYQGRKTPGVPPKADLVFLVELVGSHA